MFYNMLKRKLIAMKKVNTLFFFVCFTLICLISVSYSALSQNLMITGDIEYFLESKKLYDVLMREARMDRLAREYTGAHQDSLSGTGDKDIFYYYATNTAEGDAIQNKNNVIFAGQCWQMIRTTDTGGVKMIYNGEPVNNQCLNTRGTHVGYGGVVTSSTLNSSYYYGTSYSYDSENQVFSLAGTLTQATWNATTGPTLIGKYTCKSATKDGTCETLYFTESYRDATKAVVLSLNGNSPYSEFGTLSYNASYNSLAYVGYMYNPNNLILWADNIAADSGSLYGTGVTYSGSTYTLTNTSTTYDANHHYTCNNTTGTCSTVRYYYYDNYYIELTDGRNIEDAIEDMLSDSSVNQTNSTIKTGIDAWYARYLSEYANYLEDTIFCNDRTILSLGGWNSTEGGITAEASNHLKFLAYTGENDLSCSNITDQFSVSNSSAQLTYKVGLMNSSEMNLLNNGNASVTGQWYWLMSPYYFGPNAARVRQINASGIVVTDNGGVNYANGVRPAISLVYGTEYVSGDGSMANPYIVDDSIANTTWDYPYTGSEQIFTAPEDGIYKLEAWGAQGGGDANASGGKGGYTAGIINLNKNDKLYIYVGQEGLHNATVTNVGGWNGGGYSGNNTGSNAYGGGGSTDYRLVSASASSMTAWNEITSLRSRIMVAGGGGGNFGTTNYTKGPGVGGNLTGGSATGNYDSSTVTGGSQVAGGTNSAISGKAGLFGSGVQTNVSGWGGGGGGGYWGGATGNGKSGGGGSSYISGHLGSVAVASSNSTSPRVSDTNSQACTMSSALTDISCSYHYSNYIFEDTIMRSGAETQPTHNGTSTMTGNSGDGYAKITILDQHLVTITPEIDETGTVSPTSKVVGHEGSAKFTITPSNGYVYVSNTCGGTVSGNTLTISNVTSSITCTVFFGKQDVFDYTGNEQTFIAPEDGIYRLEIWGAQGGNANTLIGGYGGYSTGEVFLNQNDVLYINVGGQGAATTGGTDEVAAGGYNGGGSGHSSANNTGEYSTGGGGATHIATSSGILSTLENNQTNLLIVAGGGTGSYHGTTTTYCTETGHGGGFHGVDGTIQRGSETLTAPGATQTNGYAFGTGQSYTDNQARPGAGGGYYGGVTEKNGGSGGSGYIGNNSLYNKHMACYNCTTSTAIHTKTISTTNVSTTAEVDKAKTGNGYARITFINDEAYTVTVISADPTRGTITPSSIVVGKGETAQFTINSSPNYEYYTNSCGGVVEGNELTISNVNENITCTIEFKTLANFDYTGGEQTFTIPETGIYKLEVWGAQGGSYNSSCIGGYGAYSVGNVFLQQGDILYVNVGGEGSGDGTHTNQTGGYNGGGNATIDSDGHTRQSSGGGTTHIATSSGLLSSFENNRDNILIVSGGGGGGSANSAVMCTSGGNGGGIQGNNGASYSESSTICGTGYGATQSSGGSYSSCSGVSSTYYSSGSFGIGSSSVYAGGGGGYYGGGVSISSAGGGSGYIGNASLFSKHMTCYNCTTSNLVNTKTISNTNVSATATSDSSKTGNGYARITFVQADSYLVAVTSIDTSKGTVAPTSVRVGKGSSVDFALSPTSGYKYYSNTCGGTVSNNILTISNVNQNITCTVRYVTSKNFDYTGGEQTFTTPEDGLYKLEVWGGQGGGNNGGYGAYSTGDVVLAQNSILYINVGGQGAQYGGGYNGGGTGGSGNSQWAYGGGGATHIGTQTGLLSTYASDTTKLLITAGGGGGGGGSHNASPGGAGGGIAGNSGYDGYNNSYSYFNGLGASQDAAGYANNCGVTSSGSFGLGADFCNSTYGGAGGGGGYYGGGGSNRGHGGGGGGSGYIGNGLLLNKHMTCYNCTTSNEIATKTISNTNVSATATTDSSKSGTGYAKITFIEDVDLSATYTLTFNTHGGTTCSPSSITSQDHSIWGTLCTTTKSGYVFKEWNTAADGSGTVITSNSLATSNLTIHAIWLPINRITYDSQEGSVCDPAYKDQVQGMAWGSLCTPTKSGYAFGGWYTEIGGAGTKITESSIVTSNVTVYAFWQNIPSMSTSTTSLTIKPTLETGCKGTTGYCNIKNGSTNFTVSAGVAGNYSFSYNSGLIGITRNGSTISVWQPISKRSSTATTTLTVIFTPTDPNYATVTKTINVTVLYAKSDCDWEDNIYLSGCEGVNSTHCTGWFINLTNNSTIRGKTVCDPS